MLMPRFLAALLWPLAVVVAFAICAYWIVDTQSGKISAWVILPFFWGAALMAVIAHYVAQWRDPISRYLASRWPARAPAPSFPNRAER